MDRISYIGRYLHSTFDSAQPKNFDLDLKTMTQFFAKPNLLNLLLAFLFPIVNLAADRGIQHNPIAKTITISVPDKRLSLVIDYSSGCRISQLFINGRNTLSSSGAYTGIQTSSASYSSLLARLLVKQLSKGIRVEHILYGEKAAPIEETWTFLLQDDKIVWNIDRIYSRPIELERISLPEWNFSSLHTWKGSILDNGGMVWCKYLRQINDTYGVHTGGLVLWNADYEDALQINYKPGNDYQVATTFSHTPQGEFNCRQLLSRSPLEQRYGLSRFISSKADPFAAFQQPKGHVNASIELKYVDYPKVYSRGNLPGIDAIAVRELLNTTGRYGVVDNGIVGGNGWLTNWKCLHEPFFAQMGMALGDSNYTRNMAYTLDQERDLAMHPDGRVLSRWHNASGDEIPGTYNEHTGYYEAMWGYTIDSQTGYLINTTEQFDLSGDLQWLRSHKASCEKALDWLLSRDSNHNGLFEMMNSSTAEKTASDWLDIVWASFENAFVNAQLYEALRKWAVCEKILGDNERSNHYSQIADHLKIAFNRPIDQGGFWSPEKRQYIYWRDSDGSTHGDNLVTPVNFAAIAFGICDDSLRISMVLDQIEERTTAENLFHWPLCFDSFQQNEVHANNWPFPTYENGDIFPTWGYLGIRAYANYNRHTAIKYIVKLLDQYRKDGLSSQRYSRITQLGLGDDILAGISTSITALYRDIYGLRPGWNRLGLEPHLINEMDGTAFSYNLRGIPYQIRLNEHDFSMQTPGFRVHSKNSFGADKQGNTLTIYLNNREEKLLKITSSNTQFIDIGEMSSTDSTLDWSLPAAGNYEFALTGLQPAGDYLLYVKHAPLTLKASVEGVISIKNSFQANTRFSLKRK